MGSIKKWYESKTVWASIVTIIAGFLGYFGIDLDTGSQEAITTNIVSVVAALGGLVSLFGRLVADRKIG